MPHGMTEYLVMTRGANLVARSVIPDYTKSIFRDFSSEGHLESLGRMIEDQPRDATMIEGFRQSVLALEPLCKREHERKYAETMVKTISTVPTSSFLGEQSRPRKLRSLLTYPYHSLATVCPAIHDAEHDEQRRVPGLY